MGIDEGIVIAIVLVLYLLFLSVVMAYAVVSYILGSKGMYAIAARRGIPNPWMAWIPVACNWTLGSISDQYQLRKYGQDPNLRKTLLIFSIITGSSMAGSSFGSFSVNLNLNNMSEISGPTFMPELPEALRIVLVVLAVVVLFIAIGALVLSIIQTVLQYKAYYSLYASCKPQLAVLFLVLSIVTPAGPFLTYACRNSDEGLPPEEAPAAEPQQ